MLHVCSIKCKFSFITVTRVIIVIVMVISLGSNRNIIYYIGPICPCNSYSNRDNLEVIVIVIYYFLV